MDLIFMLFQKALRTAEAANVPGSAASITMYYGNAIRLKSRASW